MHIRFHFSVHHMNYAQKPYTLTKRSFKIRAILRQSHDIAQIDHTTRYSVRQFSLTGCSSMLRVEKGLLKMSEEVGTE